MGARMPPLAAEGHRRATLHMARRSGHRCSIHSDVRAIPAPARAVMASVRHCETVGLDALEALADDFLSGGVDAAGCRRCALCGGCAAGVFPTATGRHVAPRHRCGCSPNAEAVPVLWLYARRRCGD